MKKTILLISLLFTLTSMPMMAKAKPLSSAEPEAQEVLQSDIRISVKGNSLRIVGASGLVVDIYNVTGQKVKSIKLNANDETVNTGLPKGCYIVKVGDVVRKISIG